MTHRAMRGIGERRARPQPARSRSPRRTTKNAALTPPPRRCARATPAILAANAKDVAAAKRAGRPASFVDRLLLDEKRIAGIAKA